MSLDRKRFTDDEQVDSRFIGLGGIESPADPRMVEPKQ